MEAGALVVAVLVGGRGVGGLETRGGGGVAAEVEVEGGFGGCRWWGEGDRRGEGEAARVGRGSWSWMWRGVSRV